MHQARRGAEAEGNGPPLRLAWQFRKRRLAVKRCRLAERQGRRRLAGADGGDHRYHGFCHDLWAVSLDDMGRVDRPLRPTKEACGKAYVLKHPYGLRRIWPDCRRRRCNVGRREHVRGYLAVHGHRAGGLLGRGRKDRVQLGAPIAPCLRSPRQHKRCTGGPRRDTTRPVGMFRRRGSPCGGQAPVDLAALALQAIRSRRRDPLDRGVQQDQAVHLTGAPRGEDARVEAAGGVRNHDKGAVNLGCIERLVEVAGDRRSVPRFRPRFAVPGSSTVIGAHTANAL